MSKKGAIFGSLAALIVLAWAGPAFAATVKITDSGLQPWTKTVSRGEKIVWIDATTDQNAQVALDFSSWRAGIRVSRSKQGDVWATFEKPGTYGYSAHVSATLFFPESSGGPPYAFRGEVVVK